MISYSRQQKALEELAELETITKRKKLEQEKQEAIELFREQTKDIHTTREQSIEEINQWCGNRTFTEKLHDIIEKYNLKIVLIFTVILDTIFVFLAINVENITDVIFMILLFILLIRFA